MGGWKSCMCAHARSRKERAWGYDVLEDAWSQSDIKLSNDESRREE